MSSALTAPWKYNLHDPLLGLPRNLVEGINTRIVCGEQVMLSVVRLDAGATSALHHHPEEQWGVLLEGNCVRVQGGIEVSMKKGDFWHTPSNAPHGIKAGPDGALILDIFAPPRPEYKVPGQGYGQGQGEKLN
ncbi:MAG TPA: cupin domain-containing protein [Opitutaceae bacterium]|nr:cupin domain-containing protein [Opitutaceae bacterium]